MTNQNQARARATGIVLTTANAGQIFHAELTDWADQLPLGTYAAAYYAKAYADEVVIFAGAYADARGGYADADVPGLLQLLGEAADPGSDFFSKSMAAQVPWCTHQLVTAWAAVGYPLAGRADSHVFEQIRAGLAERIADRVPSTGVTAKLAQLRADFKTRYAAAEKRERAEAELAD